jgi:glycosyltransferase involved in cell wall biosynthesis
MKKILFLMPAMKGGGAERTLINLLTKIDYTKYEIDLLVVSNNGIYINEIPKEVRLITLLNNDLFARILAYLQKKYGLFFIFRWLINFKKLKKYDVGISFLDGDTTDLLFLIKNLKNRLAWVHSSYKSNTNFSKYYQNENYKIKLKIKRYGKLDGIYFVSSDSKEEFIEVFGSYPNMNVIYNLIDTDSIKRKSIQEIIESSCVFTFLALGSLMPVKGFDRLIRASKIVKDKGFDFNLNIIGEGKELSNIRDLILHLGLQETVFLLGYKSNPYPYLKSTDVFVMSSVSEALPTVLCEAMILGKPVLVTNCCGCRELVDNENYGLLSGQNDEELAKKMIKFLIEPDLLKYYAEKSLIRSKIFDDKLAIKEYYKIFNI